MCRGGVVGCLALRSLASIEGTRCVSRRRGGGGSIAVPTDRKYAESHEWCMPGSGGEVTVGITEFAQVRGQPPLASSISPPARPRAPCPRPEAWVARAQSELGDVVYVELPEVGATVTKKETFGVVESVKVRDYLFPIAIPCKARTNDGAVHIVHPSCA